MLDQIGSIIDKYGTSYEETKKMLAELSGKLPSALKTFKSSFTPPRRETMYLNPYQAKQYGIDIKEGWQVKVLPVDDPQGIPHYNLIMPDMWEMTDYGTFVSPEGIRYTAEQYAELEPWTIPHQKEYLINRLAISDQMPVGERMRAETEQLQFLETIKTYERTPELEDLLKELFNASDLDLDELFGQKLLPWQDPKYLSGDFVDLWGLIEPEKNIETALMGFPNPFKPDDGFSIFSPKWFWEKGKDLWEIANLKTFQEKNIALGEEFVPDWLQDMTSYFWGGTGNILRNLAGAADWKGVEGMGDKLRAFAELGGLPEQPRPEIEERGWRIIKDPQFYTQMMPEILPFTMAIIPLSLIGAPVVGALGLGTAATVILTAIAGGAVSSMFEGMMEGAQTYEAGISKGWTHEQADKAADETFWKNIGLLGASNTAQIAGALARFKPFGGPALGLFVKLLFEAGSEAVEELMQDIFQRQSLGEEIKFDYQMQEATIAGGIMGLGFGGAIDAYGRIIDRSINNLPSTLFKEFDEVYTEAKEGGATHQEAALKGLDSIVTTPEGKQAILDAVNETKMDEARRQLEKMGKDDFIVPSTEAIIKSEFAQNMYKRMEQQLAKLPGMRKIIETAFGTRELTEAESEITKDVVGRNAIAWHMIQKQGNDLATAEIWIMRAIFTNPIKAFGMNKVGYSRQMFDLLKPEFRTEKIQAVAGTLEHVFTHQEMYNLTDKQNKYISKVLHIFHRLLAQAKREGTAPKRLVMGEYIHRVVTGKIVDGELVPIRGPAGRGGKALGARDKSRVYRTMAEGIADDTAYSPNIEDAIRTSIQNDYKKIADKRFAEAMSDYGDTPLDILMERYPDLEKNYHETKVEFKRANQFRAAVQIASRGGVLPDSQVKALTRHYPYIMERLMALTNQRKDNSELLRREVTRLSDVINKIKKAKAEAPAITTVEELSKAYKELMFPETKTGIPQAKKRVITQTELTTALDEAKALNNQVTQLNNVIKELSRTKFVDKTDEEKIREAFHLMDYKQRAELHNAYLGIVADLEQQQYEMKAHAEVMEEVLAADPIYNWRGLKYKFGREIKLTDMLEHGEWPETITKKQALALLGPHAKLEPNVLDKTGKRVRWEYIIDQVWETEEIKQFYASEQAFLDGIEKVAKDASSIGVMLDSAEEIQGDIEKTKMYAEWLSEEMSEYSKTYYDGVEEHETTTGMGEETTGLAEEPELPKQIKGMPEAGLQKDIFGFWNESRPKGKGKIVQISMDEYNRLMKQWKENGHEGTPPNIGYVPDMTGSVSPENVGYYRNDDMIDFDVQSPQATEDQIKAELKSLKDEVYNLKDSKKMAYERARIKRKEKLDKIKQGGMKLVTLPEGVTGEKGYIMQPMFGGKLYNQDFIDAINTFFGHEKGSPTLQFLADAAGILRLTKAAFDASVMAIQGAAAFGLAHSQMIVHPPTGLKLMGQWYKAFGLSVGSFIDMGYAGRYMAQNEDMILKRIREGGSSQSVDYFQTLSRQKGLGGLANKFLGALPLSPFQRAETSFFIGAEVCRDEIWKAMYSKAKKNGQLRELARFLDRMTGIIDTSAMSVPQKMRQFEQAFIWFAPRYTRACSAVLADIFRGGMTGSMARQSMAGLIGGLALYTTAFTCAQGFLNDEDEDAIRRRIMLNFGIDKDSITGETVWSPSAKIMSFKINDSYFGIGGFFYGMVRLFGKILDTINEVGDKEIIDLVKITKYGSVNRDNPFISWWYSRSSPMVSTFREGLYPLIKSAIKGELQVGRTYMGTPIETPTEYAYYMLSRFMPIWIEQGIMPFFGQHLEKYLPNIIQEFDKPSGMANILTPFAEFIGMRGFVEGEWTTFYDEAQLVINNLPKEWLAKYYNEEELKLVLEAHERGELSFKQLPKQAKQDLKNENEDLQQLWEYASEASGIQNSDSWKSYYARLEEERDYRNTRLQNAEDRLKDGEITAYEYREIVEDIMTIYHKGYEDIQNNEAHKEVMEFWERLDERGSKYDWSLDFALQEYEDIIYDESLTDEITGDYDFDERKRRVGDWIDKWGMTKYEDILAYIGNNRAAQGYPELYLARKVDLEQLGREYWDTPYQPLYSMDAEDIANGEVPKEYISLVERYMNLGEAAQESFLRSYPELSRDFRAEYRANHPEHDAMLKLWGYGGDLQSMEAYNICLKRAKELGFTEEGLVQMKLPPQNIADDYFDYAKLRRDFSGNSAEAKLFRIDNPLFAEWGKEAYGWKDLEVNEAVLRLDVKYRAQDAEYDAIISSDLREEYLNNNVEYWESRLTRDAYNNNVGDIYIDKYVEYYKMPQKGYAQERFLKDNPDYYKDVWLNPDVLGNREIKFSQIPSVEYDKIYQDNLDMFKQYEALMDYDARESFLKANPDFAIVKLKYDAYGKNVDDKYIDNYVRYYSLPGKDSDPWYKDNPSVSYYEDDWFMMEHQDYYKDVWIKLLENEPRDFSRVPTREVFEIYKGYLTLPLGNARLDYRARFPDFDQWLLVAGKVSKLVGDRGIPERKSPWDIIEEARRIKELF